MHNISGYNLQFSTVIKSSCKTAISIYQSFSHCKVKYNISTKSTALISLVFKNDLFCDISSILKSCFVINIFGGVIGD